MKANETPEKLYISNSELNDAEHCIIWFKSQQNNDDIEYTLEVKEVDLEKELKEDWLFADKTEVDCLESMCLTEDMFVSLAKKYYELGMRANNPITAGEDLEEVCEQLAENARKHKAETSSPFFSPTDYKQGVIDGANWQKQQLLAKAIDEVVKIDAGGYPYVDRTIELYDYDKDIPLAKRGDKVNILVIRED